MQRPLLESLINPGKHVHEPLFMISNIGHAQTKLVVFLINPGLHKQILSIFKYSLGPQANAIKNDNYLIFWN